jgi:hypothetical protein
MATIVLPAFSALLPTCTERYQEQQSALLFHVLTTSSQRTKSRADYKYGAHTSMAAATAAPELMPTNTPSLVAISLEVAMALLESIFTISLISEVSQFWGMKPAPIPWILWGPGGPPLSTADSTGSTATRCRLGFLVRRN